ncbi:serine carboxypeptidase S28-domain-containing protein [Aspergillus bertholletiae]|uniref:Serine carboxypeptidase S28-domain-containing protein n=1 Tax=Aspergillus bertholletiae TaxID=1226010 RepID=A0A5N7BI92_9EURO|nr:serine carboxypeptidase S28-domain-containing protein [Aspergillus bertholletiae]
MHFLAPLSVVTLLASWPLLGYAIHPPKPVPPPVSRPVSTRSSAVVGEATFDQLLDHHDSSKGTFSQRYWWSTEYWGGPGSPVVLFTPGEASADGYQGYLTNTTLTGRYAQEIQGAVILIEHRYWGGSSPYKELTAETLQYLTLEQSILDLTYFAETVSLEFDPSNRSNAPKAPWVLVGGSYSGALAAWTAAVAPETFWAYHATSAPVEAINDFWQYFDPIRQGMAPNCSRDVSLVATHIDRVGKHGSAAEQLALKELFGLGAVEHYDDFAAALPIGPYKWQSNTFVTGYSGFFAFCDAVENVKAGATVVPGPEGVGLQKALRGYAKWFKSTILPGYCANYGYWTDNQTVACFDTYNPSSAIFTDTSVDNAVDRQWQWFLCNEPFFWWQDGAPEGIPTIIPRTVNAAYWQRQCSLYFPEVNGYTYGSAKGKTAATVNQWTGGWSATRNTSHLLWVNGQYDPWRDSGVSSIYRPGGPLKSTADEPVQVIPGGFHCSDLYLKDYYANDGVKQVIDNAVAQIKSWVAEYYN